MAHLTLRGESLGRFAAVLFDKDGTLSHSEPLLITLAEARVFHCRQQLQAAHPELGEPALAELDHLLRRAYGLDPEGVHPAGTTAVASREHNRISTATALAQVGLGWPEALALADAVFLATDGLTHGGASSESARPTEGLCDLLEELAAAGLRCAVISNDGEAGIQHFLEHNGLTAYFCGCWSADHRPCKPDPAAVFGLCGQLGVEPRHCLLIGDANSDLRMARSAGLSGVLGYTAGWRRRPPLDPSFPQLHHWSELAVATEG
ncbi:MAG: HAD family hydrolase [Cyanobacteriota bacterium]|nr:HAD family hydrolase [Cyanobacteriota bacterium]